MKTAEKYYNHLALIGGYLGHRRGPAYVQRTLQVGPGFPKYWKKRFVDANFHNGEWGGARNNKFNDVDQKQLDEALWQAVKAEPTLTCPELASALTLIGYDVNGK